MEWDVHVLKDVVVAQGKDVTERERLRILHEQHEERLRLIFDSSQNFISLIRMRDMEVVECNSTFQNLLGVPREQLVGKTILPFFKGNNTAVWEGILKKVREEGRFKNFEITLQGIEIERVFI